jgi:hypothetical protein
MLVEAKKNAKKVYGTDEEEKAIFVKSVSYRLIIAQEILKMFVHKEWSLNSNKIKYDNIDYYHILQ